MFGAAIALETTPTLLSGAKLTRFQPTQPGTFVFVHEAQLDQYRRSTWSRLIRIRQDFENKPGQTF